MLYRIGKVSQSLGKSFLSLLILFNLIVLIWVIQSTKDSSPAVASNTIKDSITHHTTGQLIDYKLPDRLQFADEDVPLDRTLVRERLDEVMVSALYRHSNTILRYKRAARWFPEIERILKQHKIPEDFKYLAIVESNLQNLISVKGATGFWQFMPATAQQYGLEVSAQVDERYHPIKSTEAAVKYLKDAYRKFKSWTLVAASYNMGMRGLQIQMEQQRVNSFYELHLNPETAAYLYHILAVKCIFENPAKFGYPIREEQRYPPIEFNKLKISRSMPDLVSFAKEQHINYDVLKVYNPWLRSRSLVISTPGKEYIILIPKDLDSLKD